MQQQIEPVEATHAPLASDVGGSSESRLTAVLSALLAAFLGLLIAGLLAAMAGMHHWFVVGPVGTLLTFGLYQLLPRNLAIPKLSRAAALALMVVVVGAVLSNVVLRSNLVVAGRDGATYANTAAFLVDGANLFPRAISEPFTAENGLTFGAPGFVVRDDGTMWQQFLHSMPAAMGFVGELLGRGAMFSFNAFVSGLGILSLFALGRRFMGEWWAIAAATLMASSLPYVYYSRGSFAEIATLTLVAGGLWTAHVALADQPQLALGGGLLLGGAAMVRVDAWMIGLALAAFLVMTTWLREQREAWIAGRLFTGFAIAGFIGLLDLALFAQPYLTILRTTLIPLLGAVVLVRLLEPFLRTEAVRRLGDHLQTQRLLVGRVIVTIGAATVAYLWFVRPLLHPARLPIPNGLYGLEAIQLRDGIPVDPSRTYFELSVWWLTWYIGLPLTAIGFVGFLSSLAKSLRRNMAAIRLIVLTFAVSALTYLVRPAVNPDQIWAIRRFTPVIIPGLVLFAFASLAHVYATHQRGSRVRRLVVAMSLASSLPALLISAPLIGVADRAGVEAQFAGLCDELANVESLLIINDDTEVPLSGFVGPPLRSWCGISVAGADPALAEPTRAAAVMASRPGLLPGEVELTYLLEAPAWERRLTAAPSGTEVRSIELFVGFP